MEPTPKLFQCLEGVWDPQETERILAAKDGEVLKTVHRMAGLTEDGDALVLAAFHIIEIARQRLVREGRRGVLIRVADHVYKELQPDVAEGQDPRI